MNYLPRLLVLDDERAITRIVGLLAARLGWRVTEAHSRNSFLQALSHTSYDVVLTDYNMPEMNGLEAVCHLRKSGFAKTVLVMSSSLSGALKKDFKKLGVLDFLEKPFDREELESQLGNALQNSCPGLSLAG